MGFAQLSTSSFYNRSFHPTALSLTGRDQQDIDYRSRDTTESERRVLKITRFNSDGPRRQHIRDSHDLLFYSHHFHQRAA
ncbi:hypothetical protein CORC01_10402 [Colletotrichum orchidophilum]|uniref:Uncharacterized protein n=1 Tax=Colletotrichum orchidophilum TaxID=1209926 RepID=A0A1G4AZ32_9PEZI|nr:uncharacterized protein CORC01_10402 [Colletotrichum orchidophilum]OHE94355.1 hypothetical protein CORC01_10402 [Colletotrichum orchidophilum]